MFFLIFPFLGWCSNLTNKNNRLLLTSDFVSATFKKPTTVPTAKSIAATQPPHYYTVADKKISEIPELLGVKIGLKKVEYVIVINEKYGSKKLDEIADYIKSNEKIQHVFVSFYLNNMSLNGPNYAISKRTPDTNSTQINYVEPVKESPKHKAPYAGSEIIGTWQMALGATTTIYKKGNSFYMVDQYSEDSYSDPEKLIRFSTNGYSAFKYVEDTGEVFVIMKDGLYGFMDGDLSSVFSKIR